MVINMVFGFGKKTIEPIKRFTGKLMRVVTLGTDITIEERLTVRRNLRQLESLYLTDPLIFRDVHRITQLTVGGGFEIVNGSDIARNIIKDFLNNLSRDALTIFATSFKDQWLYGNSFLELVMNKKGDKIIDLISIDPKLIDFIKKANKVEMDPQEPTKILGYKYKGTIPYKDLPRETVAHFKLFSIGELDMGVSPLEPLYKPTIIRMNIEEAMGEGGWVLSRPPIIVKVTGEDEEATAKRIKDVEQSLRVSKPMVGLVVPGEWEVNMLNPKGMDSLEKILDYLIDLHSIAFGIPKGLYRGKVDRATLDEQIKELLMNIKSYQKIYSEQIRDQIFKRVLKYHGIEENRDIPNIKFKTLSYNEILQMFRSLAVVTRAGLVTYDKDTEDYLRKELGLPSKIVDEQ